MQPLQQSESEFHGIQVQKHIGSQILGMGRGHVTFF